MRNIIVYVDEGVSGSSLRHVVKSLQLEIGSDQYRLKRMDAAGIRSQDWELDADLLVVPGGRDVYYHEKLGQEGASRIKTFVQSGGAYLGICAGAYFAASEIEFEKGGHLEVCGKRRLQFFPGMAIGSAYGNNKYRYDSEQGVEAALIHWKNSLHSFAYFNGGCYFDRPDHHSNVTVLADYAELEENPAAIVMCDVSKGKALLSGVHLEYGLQALTEGNPYLDRIYPLLKKTDNARRQIFREILTHAGLVLTSGD